MSRKNWWDSVYEQNSPPKMYSDDKTAERGAEYLDIPSVKTIEDWGCGWGGFKNYIGSHQRYVGIDGSQTPAADKIVDLETYKSEVDAIYMRHVLEHNPGWKNILENAVQSFTKHLVIVIFTPFQEDETRIIQEYDNWNGTGQTMVDIGFKYEDITQCLGDLVFITENLKTPTQYGVETIFYISK